MRTARQPKARGVPLLIMAGAMSALVCVSCTSGIGALHTSRARTIVTTTTTTDPPATTTTDVPTTRAVPVTTATTTTPTTAPPCPPGVAGQLASTGSANQLMVVEAPTAATTSATFTAWQRDGRCWQPVFGPWTARIGANGFSDHKREGDNTTPTGAYGMGSVVYGNAADPGVHYSYHRLVCGDWWDEDPSSPQYNTFQHVACGQTPPFGGGSEALWQETTAYPSFAVVDYNTSPITPGAGSAIFLHADVGGPTAGCISLPLGQLDEVLDWLQPSASPLMVLGTDSEVTRF